jgi:hypothetical protein
MEELLSKAAEETAQRAAAMPDEKAAIHAMFQAFERLRELGWKDVTYCPKDGSLFKVIEAGSTGIHDCRYYDDMFMLECDGDIWPTKTGPVLFKVDGTHTERLDAE